MDNTEDFSMFATSPRVTSKQSEAPKKSPFASATQMIKETYEASTQTDTTHQMQPKKKEVVMEEEIINVGSELQKFRKYPKKSFDKCINKIMKKNIL